MIHHRDTEGAKKRKIHHRDAEGTEGKGKLTMRTADKDDPLTYDIIGAAIDAHRILGPGLLESVYEEALCIELEERGLSLERQKRIDIDYRGRIIGDLFADIIVESGVILELKSVEKLLPIHTAQLLTYLKLTGIQKGLLINFNVATLKQGIKRIIL